MLGKLLKYEMKASARTLLPLYIGTLVVALICGVQTAMMIQSAHQGDVWIQVGQYSTNNLVSTFAFLLFFALCVAIMILTAVIIIQRFNKSLIGDEGYLMFTLPVTHVQLLSSKVLAGFLWVLLGTLVMGLAAIIIAIPSGVLFFPWGEIDWAQLWNDIQYTLNSWNPFPYLVGIGLNAVIGVICFILVAYLSIMIGQMEQFNKHRVVISVILYFIIQWAFSLVKTSIFRVLGINFFYHMETYAAPIYQMYLWGNVAFGLVQGALCFAGIIWLMKHKLNL